MGSAAKVVAEAGRTAAAPLPATKRPRPTPPSVPAATDSTPAVQNARCEAEWKRVLALPPLPGTPELDKQRAETVARAKGEPVVFVRAPVHAPTNSSIIRGYQRVLRDSRFPWDLLEQIQDRFRYAPRIGRQVLLRDGYLYAENPDLAWSLWEKVRLEHLFDEPGLWIERGGSVLRVVRDPKRGYLYADGPDQGQPARLLLFDRVGLEGEPRPAPLHRDLRTLAHELGFERMKLAKVTEQRLLVELRYGEQWVRTVLSSHGARVERECEIVPDASRAALERTRTTLAQRQRVLAALRAAMLAQVREELAFDEPKTEWGQQDGHLRRHWEKAYLRGEDGYLFNADRYPVFTKDGQPAPPQVCVDFITETLERASGTWWRPRGQQPGRDQGLLDFDALLSGSRRQVTSFIQLTASDPERFEHELLPSPKRLPYLFKRQFYAHLRREADRYAPGDIVIIRGYAPWDHYNVPHYHAFFVYESDPVTGVPILLAGNAGKPRVQSWEPVMSRTPQRSIHYRIRPKLEWLAQMIPERGRPEPGTGAPPLVAMF